MRVAVISDIHANLPALEAVLADIDRQAVTQVFCAGDLVGQGPHPNQVVSRVRKAGIPAILGNQEIEVRTLADRGRPDPKRHMLWTIAVLKRKNREYLLGLLGDRDGFLAARVDASARFISKGIEAETLRRMLTIADGKPIEGR